MSAPSSSPPVIQTQQQAPTSTKKSFASQAAQASLLAPLISVGVNIAVNFGMAGRTSPSGQIITGSLCTLLIVLGFAFGIIALFGVRRHGKKGIFGRAVAGTCINGLLIAVMVASIPALMKAAERAKEMRQRQNSELQQTPP